MKKQWMKRILGLTLSAVLMLGSVNPAFAAGVQTTTVQEAKSELGVVEELDAVQISQTEADTLSTPLVLNQAYEDMLETHDAINWYKFSITQRGYMNVTLTVDAGTNQDDIDDGWNIEVYKKGDLVNPIKSFHGVTRDFTFPKLPMEADNYYIRICANDARFGNDDAPTGCKYHLNVKFTADNYWEVEDNDTNVTANVMNVNTNYYGNLYHHNDVDWYKTTVTQEGYIQLSLTVGNDTNIDDIDDGWNIYVYDASYQLIKSYTYVKTNFTAPILPFSKGTYYIKVCAADARFGNDDAPTDCTYLLKLASVASTIWETEYNDTNVTADAIKVNQEYYGLLYHHNDVDWYKVTTTKNGYFRIHLTVDPSVNVDNIDDGWNVTVYYKDLEEIKTYSGLTQSGIAQILPYEKGTYYIKVYANDARFGDDDAPTDCIYRLKVEEKADGAWESEGNWDRNHADSISLNKIYNGVTTYAGDEDWYKLAVKSNGRIKIALNKEKSVNIEDVHDGWDIVLYNATSAEHINITEYIKNDGTLEMDVSKGTYFIKICAADARFGDSDAPTQCIYQFKVTHLQSPAQVKKIKSAKATKKQVTLKWGKAKNASGYYIFRSTSPDKDFEQIATIKKGSTVKYTDKKALERKTTYYYKVVAYRTSKGVTAIAKESAVKKVKTK